MLAEGVGFEPTRERKPPGGFQDRCLKPLGHPSKSLQCLSKAQSALAPETRFATALLPFRVAAAIYGVAHHVVNASCRLTLYAWQHMRIQIERDPDFAVPEALAGDLRMHAALEHLSGVGVT